ncbi:ionotropic receptor 21a [Procambarus clarkii]|uniref:ionotropic receptor 21a n=1 Tax=Procambarus clarkii TaxID=6728 RepID=UPI003742581E
MAMLAPNNTTFYSQQVWWWRAAEASLMQGQLWHCSFTLLAAQDHFAASLSLHLVLFMVTHGLPYQVISAGGSRETRTTWRSTGCDVYIIVAQNLLEFAHLLDKNDDEWDWQGRYFMFSYSSSADLERLAVMYKLQKTSAILFFIPGGSEGELAVYTHKLYSRTNLRFLTFWRDGAFLSNVHFFPKKEVVDLSGQRLRVLAVDHAPSVFSHLDDKALHLDEQGLLFNVSGLDVKVVNALGEALNFTPVFYSPGQDMWGTLLPNGTFTGMVGQVHKDEAEMGIGNVFLTEVRARYVTFSVPFDFERACFLTPAPRLLPAWMAVSFPFTLHVWMLLMGCVLGLTVLVPVLGWCLPARDPRELQSVSSAFLVILGHFSNQSPRPPKHIPMQMLLGAVMVSGFVVTIFYCSNLTAYMMVRVVEQPITTIRQIVQRKLAVGGYSDFWVDIFKGSANQDVHSLIWNFLLFDNVTNFLKQVISGRGVLLENTQHLQYLRETHLTNSVDQASVRLMLEECINPFSVGVMLKRNSPLKSSIDKVIQGLRESGLVNRYFLEVLQEDHDRISSLARSSPDTAPPAEGVQVLTLEHLQVSASIKSSKHKCLQKEWYG